MIYIKTKYNNKTYELRNLSQLINILATEQTNSNSIDKINPIIEWNPVQNVQINSKLGNDALNAIAYDENDNELTGEFIYIPGEDYIPTELGNLSIKLFFVPTNLNGYNIIQTEKTINIVE